MGKLVLFLFEWLPFAFCLLVTSTDGMAQNREATAASYVELGDKFAGHADLERAIGAYTVALQFEPAYVPAYFKRGLAEQQREHLDAAIADYTKTLEMAPNCAEAYDNRAQVFAIRQELEKAFAD